MRIPLASLRQFQDANVQIWCARLDGWDESSRDLFQGLLAKDEKLRASSFLFRQDRLRYAAARGLLRLLLSAHTEDEPERVPLTCRPDGKPCLDRDSSRRDVYFNISHSNGLAILAITRLGEIGADVEFIRDLPDLQSIASQCFHPRELAALSRLAHTEKCRTFFRCWARKEALFKATGEGLLGSFADVDVRPERASPVTLVKVQAGARENNWAIQDVWVGDGFAAALATQDQNATYAVFHLPGGALSASMWPAKPIHNPDLERS